MPEHTKKISQLTTITAAGINPSDIFVVTDVSESISSKITFENVTNAIFSDANIEIKAPSIVTKLNAINSGVQSLSNGLNAGGLYYNEAYRDGAYFLEWANVNNKPIIPADLSDLNNTGQFVSYSPDLERMRVFGTADNGATLLDMASDYLIEGVDNLFYTDDRVEIKVNAIFGGLFNEYSDTFDGGEVIDSLDEIDGTFQNVTNSLSSVIRINDVTLAKHFKVGQTLRLYGASTSSELISGSPSPTTISVQGQSGFSEGGAASNKTLSYKFAFYNTQTGEIGPLSNTTMSKQVQYTPDGGSTFLNPLPYFNTDNFIKFTGLSAGNNQGILVYRQIDDGPFKLLAVLGPKDFGGNGTWSDYHKFTYTPWGGKDTADNTYSSIVHFPLSSTTFISAQRGWVDANIKTIDVRADHFFITLGDSASDSIQQVYVNPSPHSVTVCHNDTSKINEAIQSRSSSGNKSVTLNGKVYMATHLIIPNDFGMIGTANVTKIKKLPWSQMAGENYDNSILKTQNESEADTISLYGIDFDGNVLNQALVNDGVDPSLNYAIDFGTQPTDILIDRCRIRNVAGGGIFADRPKAMRITTGEIVNSGVTDLYPFSPLLASDGESTILTSNRFENFPDSVDVSVTQEGMVANNIVKACGSGLLVAGSTFMVSSPNVLIGAANEFLSSPDILNTEYDSINIPLAKFVDAGAYTSDEFVYQENGENFNLSQSSIEASAPLKGIVYRLNLIQQLSDGSTLPYAVDAGPNVLDTQYSAPISFTAADVDSGNNLIGVSGIPNGSRVTLAGDSTDGLGSGTDGTYFAKVVGNDIELYNTYTAPNTFGSQQALANDAPGTIQIVPAPGIPFVQNRRYRIKDVGTNMNWTSIGAQVGQVGEYFIYNGATVTGTNGIASSDSFAGLNNQPAPTITDIDYTDEERAEGKFKFVISDTPDNSKSLLYTGAFSPAQLQQRYNLLRSASTVGYPAGSQHLGVAWSASYRYYAAVGQILSGEWFVYKAGADGEITSAGGQILGKTTALDSLKNSPQYVVRLNNPSTRAFVVGREVIISTDHVDFQITGVQTTRFATVTSVADVPGQPSQKDVTITYNNLLGTPASPASNSLGEDSVANGNLRKGTATGQINIIDDFVIAQGLIK